MSGPQNKREFLVAWLRDVIEWRKGIREFSMDQIRKVPPELLTDSEALAGFLTAHLLKVSEKFLITGKGKIPGPTAGLVRRYVDGMKRRG